MPNPWIQAEGATRAEAREINQERAADNAFLAAAAGMLNAAKEAGKRHSFDPDSIHQDATFQQAVRKATAAAVQAGAWRQLGLF